MLTCPDCLEHLEGVLVGDPCTRCGSRGRDATVSVAQAHAIERVFPPIFVASVDRLVSQPEVQDELNANGEITLRFIPPSQGSDWLIEARSGEALLVFAPGPEFDDGDDRGSDEDEGTPSPPERLPE
jgi:hypothetical protein